MYSKNQKNVMRDTPWGLMTYFEYKKKLEFSISQYKQIDKYCKKRNLLVCFLLGFK